MADLRVDTATEQFFVKKRVKEGEEIGLIANEIPVDQKRMITRNLVEGEEVCLRGVVEPPTPVSRPDIYLRGLQRRGPIANVHNAAVDRMAAYMVTMCTTCDLTPPGAKPVTTALKLFAYDQAGLIGWRGWDEDDYKEFSTISPYVQWELEQKRLRKGDCR